MTSYAELAVTSNFSFLRGASHPQELVKKAVSLGLKAIAIADRNSMAGIVRAHTAAKECAARGQEIQLLLGARLVLLSGFEVLCYPENRAAYGRLTKLLSKGNLRAPKGECHLHMEDLGDLGADQNLIAMPPVEPDDDFRRSLLDVHRLFPGGVFLAGRFTYGGNPHGRLSELADLAASCETPLVATNDVLYHHPERRPLQDVLTCIREHCTIHEAGFRLEANAERHLKPPDEMARLFAGYEEAVARTCAIAERCTFSLDEISYQYPDEPSGNSATPQEELERLTWIGAKERYPEGFDEKVRATLTHELKLIDQLAFAPYFLTVHDIVSFARSRDILCQGRGSAANSAVCYCLGITSVNPAEVDLLFERFVSSERKEPPDIDVDFEHERREEVIQYIYDKYTRRRAGITATVISYRTRSAVREVGKAMGLSPDTVGALSGTIWGSASTGIDTAKVKEAGLDPCDDHLQQTLSLAFQLLGFPRHLSQHVGGFVITRDDLEDVVPIANAAMEDRTIVEWDKDDLDALGILKIDVLALGMLTCLKKAFDLLGRHYRRPLDLASMPREDPRVYHMMQKADTVGVFQIESRAQMSMLPRLKPVNFYDLVIEIALVRPGPIQGDMVHPYLRRRQGLEPVEYRSEALRGILEKTLGVPLFQEQAMNIAIVGASFTPEESNGLRRAMATFRRNGTIGHYKEKFIQGMLANGYDEAFAQGCFKQIEGFSDYGFPESHSASFALLAYASSWLKCHYPEVFACALLNSQPMGFYSSGAIVRDLRDHQGTVLPVDINHSRLDHSLETCENCGAKTDEGGNGFALRLGLRQVDGLSTDAGEGIEAERENGAFSSIQDFYRRTKLNKNHMEKLAEADAFRSIGIDRREAQWAIRGLIGHAQKNAAIEDLPLFEKARTMERDQRPVPFQQEDPVTLRPMALGQHVFEDYSALKLSLKAHPVTFVRGQLSAQGVITNKRLEQYANGHRTHVAGLILVRQRPGTASGVIFLTLEDETGIANIVVWPKTFERYRKTVMSGRLISVKGHLQREEGVIHVVAGHITDHTDWLLDRMGEEDEFTPHAAQTTHQATHQTTQWRHPRNVRVLPKGRNFH